MIGILLKDIKNLAQQLKYILIVMVLYGYFAYKQNSIIMLAVVLVVMCVTLPISSISYDERANWDRYALTMPVSRTQLALSKYIFGLIIAAVSVVFCVIAEIVLFESVDFMALGTIISVGLIYMSVVIPVCYKVGTEKARIVIFALYLIPAIAIFIFGKSNYMKNLIFNSNMIVMFAPVASIVLLAGSMLLSIHIYKCKQF